MPGGVLCLAGSLPKSVPQRFVRGGVPGVLWQLRTEAEKELATKKHKNYVLCFFVANFLQPGLIFQLRGFIRLFPAKLRFVAPKVAVTRRLSINRPAQIERFDDSARR